MLVISKAFLHFFNSIVIFDYFLFSRASITYPFFSKRSSFVKSCFKNIFVDILKSIFLLAQVRSSTFGSSTAEPTLVWGGGRLFPPFFGTYLKSSDL